MSSHPLFLCCFVNNSELILKTPQKNFFQSFYGINFKRSSYWCDQVKKGKVTYQQWTDEEIIAHYKTSRDKACVGELFNRYGAVVYGVSLKYLKNVAQSQDMTMHIFEKLMDLLLDKTVINFRSWLHVVSRNECLMRLRKQGKIHENSLDDSYELQADEDSLLQKQQDELVLNQLESAIQELKPEQKQCIELFYIQEKCYQQVADITGFTMKQVKSYIQNGKRNLKIILTQTKPIHE